MVGVICKLEILRHPVVTIECFGWTVFVQALLAGRDQTFLSVLGQTGTFKQTSTPLGECIDRCIAMEHRAKRIYRSLAARYQDINPACEFFGQLAAQEATHAELQGLCRVASSRRRPHDRAVDRWLSEVPETERLLTEAEQAVERHASLAEALGLVIRMESSQLNGLFTSVVCATASRFAQRFRAFGDAVYCHLDYIRQQIPVLEPALRSECERLSAAPQQ